LNKDKSNMANMACCDLTHEQFILTS